MAANNTKREKEINASHYEVLDSTDSDETTIEEISSDEKGDESGDEGQEVVADFKSSHVDWELVSFRLYKEQMRYMYTFTLFVKFQVEMSRKMNYRGHMVKQERTSWLFKVEDVSPPKGHFSFMGESSGERVVIDDHVVVDSIKENVKDGTGGEDTMGTPLEVAQMEHGTRGEDTLDAPLEAAPMEHGTIGENIMGTPLEQAPMEVGKLLENLNGNTDDHVGGGGTPIASSTGLTSSSLMLQEMKQLLEEHFHGLLVFMEAQFNQVDNMVHEQSHIVEYVVQLDKKVKKLTDVLT
ncbi:hypothetical protein Sjap_014879 [Stephania japonica]|uniref:Uncharacterized protein n=1 Tax=Stephania japonica TaxID=461633 RepID=A0AAP0IIE0_9MAGN